MPAGGRRNVAGRRRFGRQHGFRDVGTTVLVRDAAARRSRRGLRRRLFLPISRTTDKRNPASEDAVTDAVLSGLLVLPHRHGETAFDHAGRAFREVTLAVDRLLAEDNNRNVADVLFTASDGDAERCDGFIVSAGVAEFYLGTEVSEQYDGVDVGRHQKSNSI